ncbi:hypothetical protein DL768_004318 [Monosporascus sp. mg162]|nr:hypothetical protein DL768_004318 [Monosporascus sp. mg162]
MPPRSPPTHFLCIPLVTGASRPQLSASLGSFKADVTNPDSFGVPEQAIRPVGTIHLTLGVMSFPKKEGLENAVSLLKTLIPRQILASVTTKLMGESAPDPTRQSAKATESTGSSPPLLSVTLRGLHSMQLASKSSVLYASPVDQDGTLLKFCESLRSTFQEAGLMTEENRPLLLHATIMNTIYVKGGHRRGGGHGKKERLTLDARGIMDRYDNFVWMEDVPVEKIAICRMGAKKQEDGDEAYEVEAEIDFA